MADLQVSHSDPARHLIIFIIFLNGILLWMWTFHVNHRTTQLTLNTLFCPYISTWVSTPLFLVDHSFTDRKLKSTWIRPSFYIINSLLYFPFNVVYVLPSLPQCSIVSKQGTRRNTSLILPWLMGTAVGGFAALTVPSGAPPWLTLFTAPAYVILFCTLACCIHP